MLETFENKKFKKYITIIMNNEYPIFKISNKIIDVDYLHFLNIDDITSSVMKGIDKYKRLFFIIIAQIIKSDNEILDIFEIFFQKYIDNETIWDGYSPNGTYLLTIKECLTLKQIKFIKTLLNNGIIELSKDLMNDINVSDYIKKNNNISKLMYIEIILI